MRQPSMRTVQAVGCLAVVRLAHTMGLPVRAAD